MEEYWDQSVSSDCTAGLVLILCFPLSILVRNGPMISFGNFGTGKFLYEWRSHEYRNLKFSMNHERYIANPPMNGLAGVVKNNFSKSGEAASGEIVFYHNC